ncbi:hypothetical protein MMC26_005498 [Xylographa opegraphella]|nr:hypothetical protein [Xylographa opegraphella]
MPIRVARLSDLFTISSIFAAGFYNEEVVGDLMHPYRAQHHQDYLAYWRRKCWVRWCDYSRVFAVSFEQDGNEGKEVLTGVAEWQRVGLGWERVWGVWGTWDPRLLLRWTMTVVMLIFDTLWPNRAASKPPEVGPTTLEPILWPFISHHYLSPPQRRTHWSLSCLAVLPQYQNHGHGRQLVAWGLERARQDGVPAAVMAAKGKEVFYKRCGFTELVGWATDGLNNPLNGRIGGGAIMFTGTKNDSLG